MGFGMITLRLGEKVKIYDRDRWMNKFVRCARAIMVAYLRACCHSAILLVVRNVVLGAWASGLKFPGFDLVDITPDPRFAWFNRADQGVLDFLEVFGRMLVFRRIATAHVAAREAQAQVHPRVSGLNALFADVRFSCFDLDLVEVGASVVHIGVSRKHSVSVK